MPNILVVDDSPVERRLAGRILEKQFSGIVSYACDGREALLLATQVPHDLVVTDLHMPEMNGLELVKELKTQFPDLPVIVMTAFGNEEIAVQALQNGASSYVPKRHLMSKLASTADNLLRMSRARRNRQRMLGCIALSETRFVLENETALAGPLIDFVQEALVQSNLFDASFTVQLGVVLHEGITNAINHGNLEVSSDLRQNDERNFEDAIQARRNQEPYAGRKVYILVSISAEQGVKLIIRDEGPGFDVGTVLDPTLDVNLDRIGGRGLLLIRTFMDEVSHNASGNEITMLKHAVRTDRHVGRHMVDSNNDAALVCAGGDCAD